MPVKINGATNGSVTLAAPATGSDVTLTLPAAAGTAATTAYADTAGGLQLISTQVASASSGLIFNDVFTSTFDQYIIAVTLKASASGTLYGRMRLAGTDQTGSIYYNQYLEVGNTSVGGERSTDSFYKLANVRTTASGAQIILNNPALTERTSFVSHSPDYSAGTVSSILYRATSGVLDNAVAYDGINLYPSTGTITGRISIFGVKQ